MSWIFGTSTDYIDLSNDLVEAMTESSAAAVTVSNGGTGGTYVLGDILTIVGGTSTVTATVEVTGVSAGQVTTVRNYNDGVYTLSPSSPAPTTGGGGTGCTINIGLVSNGWTAQLDAVYSGSNREIIMEGEGDTSDEIFVGWRTFHDTPSGYYNWELHGMTGWDNGLAFKEQPGLSPGFFDAGASADQAGCYFTGQNSGMSYWFNINPYRVIAVIKVGSRYFPFNFGWQNRFATSTEYPYPMCVGGNTSLYTKVHSTTALMSGLTDPWRSQETGGNQAGPMMILQADNSWLDVWNASISDAGTNNYSGSVVVVPCGRPSGTTSGPPQEDRFMSAATDVPFNKIIPPSVITGGQVYNLYPTEDSGGDLRVLWPTMIIQSSPQTQVHMELDSVFWVSSFGGVASEDRIIENDEVYRVFQNGIRSEAYSFFAIKEQ